MAKIGENHELVSFELSSKDKPRRECARASHSLALPAAVIAAVGVAMSLCMAGNIAAAGLACKPDFKITNDKSRAVKVLSLVYQVGGKEHTECLNNRKLAPGEESTWKSQSFGKLAEGNAMEKIRIEYRNDTSGEGKIISDPWGPAVKTIWFTTEVEGDCKNDRTYELRIP